jgi:hypothetical protein
MHPLAQDEPLARAIGGAQGFHLEDPAQLSIGHILEIDAAEFDPRAA